MEMVLNDQTPRWADLRNFYYECRNVFLRENPDRLEIDTETKTPYSSFLDVIKYWCQKKSPEFDISPALWWRVREGLNLWPEGKATCWTSDDNFLVTHETRSRVTKGCSFLLVCEKRTVSRELLQTLEAKGYKLNLIATVGHSQSDVQEAVLEIKEAIDGDTENFYVLILHDYDLDGVRIFHTLKQRYGAVIDVGVNGEFIQWIRENSNFDPRLLEEKVLNKKYRRDLRACMIDSPEYTEEDFNYLQGDPFLTLARGKEKTHYGGKRIEIDAIHVQHGIDPFVNYILYKIDRECKVWDLSRIGVEEWGLDEPENHYGDAISQLQHDVGKAYGKKRHELSKTYHKILAIVKDALPLESDFTELDEKHRGTISYGNPSVRVNGQHAYRYEVKDVKGIFKLEAEYEEQIIREWAEDYQDRLREINGNVTMYRGDVREGEADLAERVEILQGELNAAKENDPDLEAFKDKLDEADWGEEELEAIEITPPAEEVRSVIEALQEYLEELGEG